MPQDPVVVKLPYEQNPAPEQISEQSIEVAPEIPAAAPEQPPPPPRAVPPLPTPTPVAPDEIEQEVERTLSENLSAMYVQLPPDVQQKFKMRGEEISHTISGMLRSGVLHIKKILSLIREWLAMIPGVNKFFLEQEAKIKMDKIQSIYHREHNP